MQCQQCASPEAKYQHCQGCYEDGYLFIGYIVCDDCFDYAHRVCGQY